MFKCVKFHLAEINWMTSKSMLLLETDGVFALQQKESTLVQVFLLTHPKGSFLDLQTGIPEVILDHSVSISPFSRQQVPLGF